MGSSSSKAAQTASKVASTTAPKAARKYPTRHPAPQTTQRPAQQNVRSSAKSARVEPTMHPGTRATEGQLEEIDRGASNPDLELNARLRQLGPAVPNPTFSPSSIAHSSSTHEASAATHTNTDPSTSAATFTPSASNPSQTIFPASNTAQNARSNPSVSLLTARYRLAEEAEKEFERTGKRDDAGRSFIDITTLRQMVGLREQGVEEKEIERRLGLKEGVVRRLGRKGVVGVAR